MRVERNNENNKKTDALNTESGIKVDAPAAPALGMDAPEKKAPAALKKGAAPKAAPPKAAPVKAEAPEQDAPEAPKRKSRKRKVVISLVCVAAVLLAGAAGYIFLIEPELTKDDMTRIVDSGTFYDGVSVAGVDLSGMTLEQANEAITAVEQERSQSVKLPLQLEENAFEINAEDVNITYNTDEVLNQALFIGREGTLAQRWEAIGLAESEGVPFEIDYAVDVEAAKPKVTEIAESLFIPSVDASIEVNREDKEAKELTAEIVEREAEESDEEDAEQDADGLEVSATVDQDTLVSDSQKTMDERFVYNKEQDGRQVDAEALFAEVKTRFEARDYSALEISHSPVPAAVTVQQLQAETQLIAAYTTSFAKSPYNNKNRVYNIVRCAMSFDGYEIKPGESFDINAIVGPRTYDGGWKGAPGISGGKYREEAGGGVCQVSSTLFNVVLMSMMDIEEARPHSWPLGYVDEGRDATISTGGPNLVFKNPFDYSVYLFCYPDVDEKTLTIEMYGKPFEEGWEKIDLETEKVATISPGAATTTVDNSKPVGYKSEDIKRRSGSEWNVYRVFYKNGEEVKREHCWTARYRAFAGSYIVGPAAPPAPAAPETPAEAPPAEGESADFGA